MRLIERHGKVCSGPLQLPFFDLAGVSVDDGDLADGGEIHKTLRAFFLKLERLWMSANLKLAFEALIGRGVENSDGAFGAITVSDVNAFRDRVVSDLVGILGKLHGVDQLVVIGVKNFARTIAFAGDHYAIGLGKVSHHLGLDKSLLDAVDSFAPRRIQNLDRIISVNGGEYAAILVVHSHMIEAAPYARYWNDPY
jgi:hypothetical protein